ncbi:MAG TPA: hypothetical protein VNA66_06275, partial [Gammaproteobacteria bacterium]|nr:hypothetical protein [Gammaproteobacteria bacterium]
MSIAARIEREFRRALFAGVVALAVTLPALGQRNAPEHWVTTWATALVVRPAPPAAPAAPASAAPPEAPAAAATLTAPPGPPA